MQEDVLIKKYFYNLNYIVLCEMYLNEYLKPDVIEEKDLKKIPLPGEQISAVAVQEECTPSLFELEENQHP